MKTVKPGKRGNVLAPPPVPDLDEDAAARLFAEALANTEKEELGDLGCALASEEVLAEDWLTPEEDEAWRDL
jgi:hypothetical protein